MQSLHRASSAQVFRSTFHATGCTALLAMCLWLSIGVFSSGLELIGLGVGTPQCYRFRVPLKLILGAVVFPPALVPKQVPLAMEGVSTMECAAVVWWTVSFLRPNVTKVKMFLRMLPRRAAVHYPVLSCQQSKADWRLETDLVLFCGTTCAAGVDVEHRKQCTALGVG